MPLDHLRMGEVTSVIARPQASSGLAAVSLSVTATLTTSLVSQEVLEQNKELAF